VADDGEVSFIAAEINRRTPEIKQVNQGDQAEDESVD
jgi:hypothetical protein